LGFATDRDHPENQNVDFSEGAQVWQNPLALSKELALRITSLPANALTMTGNGHPVRALNI
jgi:hypothetical protein